MDEELDNLRDEKETQGNSDEQQNSEQLSEKSKEPFSQSTLIESTCTENEHEKPVYITKDLVENSQTLKVAGESSVQIADRNNSHLQVGDGKSNPKTGTSSIIFQSRDRTSGNAHEYSNIFKIQAGEMYSGSKSPTKLGSFSSLNNSNSKAQKKETRKRASAPYTQEWDGK
ncbi:hypothetical protein AX774_g4916 [Zancudomyces culisetae]|uniref:Uncharacterized protein n=1 Tax=Zancudomyces culisetae TaxID=1213189 RepID=A0A1R1PKW8_ZANCU|nr:hypothetical protein AX774_g4916 [Zancudomyces culisetae]|eukprot:OMH81621.1 hypothetical protein AX774_g4916 [Zancudomyces culisetae]